MQLVIVESPYAAANEAELNRHLDYGRACLADCLARGESPIASHLLLTQPGVLVDAIPEQRAKAIAAGHAWMQVADLVVVYTDRGISPGMQQAIDAAKVIGCPVELRTLPVVP